MELARETEGTQASALAAARPANLALPAFGRYAHWSVATFLICALLILLGVVTGIAAVGLIRGQIVELLDYASKQSGHQVDPDVPYTTLIILALIPAAVIGATVWFLDRWEREPIAMYIVALTWGAGASVMMSFRGNAWIAQNLRAYVSDSHEFDILTSAVGASLVEEAAKGLGLLIIFYALNRYVNGPMDGIVYGLLIGIGFAFTENILYFARASIAQSLGGSVSLAGMETWTLASIFFGRAIVSPLVHPLATAVTGLFLGAACLTRHPRRNGILLGALGYGLAVVVHGLHNYSTFGGGAAQYRILVEIPVYIGAVLVIYYCAGLQRKEVRSGLERYRDEGVVKNAEIAMVMNLRNRRKARVWAGANAAELGRSASDGHQAMRQLQIELVQLGYSRTVNTQRGVRETREVRRREGARLERIASLRTVFTEE